MADKGICCVENCVNPAQRMGLCWAHYFRKRRHGHTDGVRVLRWSRQKYIQEVVLPYTGEACLLWPFNDKRGGGTMEFKRKRSPVSRIVCELAHGPAPSPQHHAAHNCGGGDVGCTAPLHLEWKTPKENCADKYIHGTMNHGERCGTSKLTEAQVQEIRRIGDSMTRAEIGRRFGISRYQVRSIINRTSWKHLGN